MGSFTVSACPDEPGSHGSRENKTTEQQLKLLLEVTNQVVSNLDFRDLLLAISSSVRRVMQCHAVGVILPEGDGKHLRHHGFAVKEGIGMPPDIPFPADASPAGEVLRTGKPITLNPIPRDKIPLGAFIPDVVDTLVELPLTSRNRTLGVLVVGVVKERPFDASDLSFLGQVANQIAIAIENSLAYRQIAELKDKLAQETLCLAEGQRLTQTGSWAWDSASEKYDYWSEEMFRIYGFDPQEGLPNRDAVFQRILPEDWNGVERNFQKTRRERVDTFNECRIVLPDGTLKYRRFRLFSGFRS